MRLIDAEELKRELKIWCYNRTTTTPTFSFVTERDIDECRTIIKPCEFCKYKRTSICGLCDDFDEFEEIDYVQEHKKIPVTLDLTPCDDAVSREDVLAEMEELNAVSFYEANEHSKEAYYEIKNMIKTIPPVTQKSGKWILLDECANSGYYCSNCQKKLVKEGWSKTVKKIKYCPNCGAKMESEDKG